MKIDENKLCFDLKILKHFIDNALGLSYDRYNITGFELLHPLVKASSHNTYVETVSDKADTFYRRIKESPIGRITHAYLNYISRMSPKKELDEKEVILAFDYTDEDFYGEVQGFDIHGWTGENGVEGKFKFLTCSIVGNGEKIPLVSIPINIGHYKSSVVKECLSLIEDYVGDIKLILFDREFYSKDLMYELTKLEYPYLIFVPKHKDKKKMLKEMDKGEQIEVFNEFKVNKDFSNYDCENILAFLKQIYDPRSERNYDWVFAASLNIKSLENLIKTYKKRWNIETSFRIQDEALIKCKSKDMKIRYFLFVFEQMLQTIWTCFFKEESSFKQFLIRMEEVSKRYCKIED